MSGSVSSYTALHGPGERRGVMCCRCACLCVCCSSLLCFHRRLVFFWSPVRRFSHGRARLWCLDTRISAPRSVTVACRKALIHVSCSSRPTLAGQTKAVLPLFVTGKIVTVGGGYFCRCKPPCPHRRLCRSWAVEPSCRPLDCIGASCGTRATIPSVTAHC